MAVALAIQGILALAVVAAAATCREGHALGLSASTWGMVATLLAIVLTVLVPRRIAAQLAPRWTAAEDRLSTTSAASIVASGWLATVAGGFLLVNARADKTPAALAGAVLFASFFVLGGTLAAQGGGIGPRGKTRVRHRSPTTEEREADAGMGAVLFLVGIVVLFIAHVRLTRRTPLLSLALVGIVALWARLMLFVAEGLSRCQCAS